MSQGRRPTSQLQGGGLEQVRTALSRLQQATFSSLPVASSQPMRLPGFLFQTSSKALPERKGILTPTD